MSRPDSSAVERHLPLPPKVTHILMAVAAEARNGYQIGIVVEEASGGRLRLSPGTLYENLDRLHRKGLIQEVAAALPTDGRGQRYWEPTGLGRAVLRSEIQRLRDAVRAAESIPGLEEDPA